MTRFTVVTALALALSAGVLACNGERAEGDEGQIEAAAESFKTDMREFRMNAEDRLDGAARRIEELRERLDEVTGEERTELEQTIEDLERRWQGFDQRLQRLDADSESAWFDLKGRVDDSLSELERSIDDAFRHWGKYEPTGGA